MAEKLSYEEFTKKAIVSLRQDNYKGIHTVYSGFNKAFCKYYGIPDVNGKPDTTKVIAVTRKLHEDKKITLIPAKNGAMLYLVGEIAASSPDNTLEKMGLKA